VRTVLINTLVEMGKNNPNLILMTGDLGYSVLEKFQEQFPNQFINAGVAEQNMIGVASGMALAGKTVFVYSIANFPSLRCLEQIRNDLCYHNANVKIISIGAGFTYGSAGYTHHGIEDMAILRALPNIRVYTPADIRETKASLENAMLYSCPCYIRLDKGGSDVLHDGEIKSVERVLPIIENNSDISILTTGTITHFVYTILKEKKLAFSLYSVPVIKPMDIQGISSIVKKSKKIFTVEEHQLDGGFGSAILEKIHELFFKGEITKIPLVHRLGFRDFIPKLVGDQNHFRDLLSIEITLN